MKSIRLKTDKRYLFIYLFLHPINNDTSHGISSIWQIDKITVKVRANATVVVIENVNSIGWFFGYDQIGYDQRLP